LFGNLIPESIAGSPLKDLPALPIAEQQYVRHFAYLAKWGELIVCGDDAKYLNHSDSPNTTDIITFLDTLLGREGKTVAAKGIKKDEELTSRYLRFDEKGRPEYIRV